jgi:hypothetical protein
VAIDAWAAAFLPQTTAEVAALLLTFNHSALPAPVRYTSNGVAVVSRGNSYQPKGLRVALPAQRPGEIPRAVVEIEDVSGLLLRLFAPVPPATPLSFTLETILLSTPDVPRQAASGLVLGGPHHSQGVTTFEVSTDRTAGEMVPVRFFNQDWPGVH